MSDIFISYANKDREQVAPLAHVLEAQGWSVFWDPVILPGQRWRKVIDKALHEARCVIVVWTSASVESDWVLEEAGEGSERGILVPILMEKARIPLGFKRMQAAQLIDWQGDGQHPAIVKLKAAVENLIGSPVKQPPAGTATGRPVPEGRPVRVEETGAKPSTKSQPLPPTFTNTIGVGFVLIPAGSFEMGESPTHTVTISKPFYLGRYVVTQQQWKAVMGENPSYFTGDDDLPVEQVSWDDAQDFIRRLNDREDCRGCYRLPTEAEWEYAARAGTTGDYAGDLDAMGWYRENADGKTHPVGRKAPNQWGLYDMHGNVWEWVEDRYGAYPSEAVTDPTGSETGSSRVIRGGSFGNTAGSARSAYRNFDAPGVRYYDLGFRLVRTAL